MKRRLSRLDAPPRDAIEGTFHAASSPFRRPRKASTIRRQTTGHLHRYRRLTGILAALAGMFTLAWAIGCAIIGASLATQGGTFTPPNHERSSRHGDLLSISLPPRS